MSPNSVHTYAIYLTETAVELHYEPRHCTTQPFSREKNYYNAVDFGRDLAAYKRLPFVDHAKPVQTKTLKSVDRSASIASVSSEVVCA